MTVRQILRYPASGLSQPALAVEKFDATLRQLVADLIDTMRAAPGIGITAPHIGIPWQVVVIELPGTAAPAAYVNPRLVWSSPEMSRNVEGSVSMPGVTERVERPMHVRVSYRDLDGAERTEEASSLLAVCLQHEIDQLDGIFWVNRLSRLKRERLLKRYEKFKT